MNIFRDLVEELKEENLLEETVIDPVGMEDDSPVAQPTPDVQGANLRQSENVARPAVPPSKPNPPLPAPPMKPAGEFKLPDHLNSAPQHPHVDSEAIKNFFTDEMTDGPETPPQVTFDFSAIKPSAPAAEASVVADAPTEQPSRPDFQQIQEFFKDDLEEFAVADQGATNEQIPASIPSVPDPVASIPRVPLAQELSVSGLGQIPPADVHFEDPSSSEVTVGEVPIEVSEDIATSEAEAKPEIPVAYEQKRRTPEEERHFYRQRATEEVAGLQLVEHVLTGVEREQMKTAPKVFDDLNVKRALHEFLKIADDINSPEHAKVEFHLMQETENWCSSLSRRDRNISVAHLRRFCETTKPSLSAQALISLARFYRNSPYSESVRGKFDLVFTKLFTKEGKNERRELIFSSKDLVKHIQELYAEWSSVPLYSTEADDPDLLLTALKFQEFIGEANISESFDELVRKDFFKRLKVFKESTHENFFAPVVVAAAIESNVAVGNKYLELIEKERETAEADDISEKYGFSHDASVSEATSKTLEILEILQAEKVELEEEVVEAPVPKAAKKKKKSNQSGDEAEEDEPAFSFFGGANKLLIAITIVMVIATAVYFTSFSGLSTPAKRGDQSAKEFSLASTGIGEYIESARLSRNTVFAIVNESWAGVEGAKKEELLKNALQSGNGKGFSKVHLLDSSGKTVAYAGKDRIKVY